MMHRLEGEWIRRASSQQVMKMLEVAGHAAYFVGGCVRDALLDRTVRDIDIATDAQPERVMELASEMGLKVVPTGIDHGTVTVVADHTGYEITTFRRDVHTDGRRAVVAFSTDVGDDAKRRDFTMNALYATREGEIVDPLGGLEDLRSGRVRFIEIPQDRIREDYLRILRFFRFHAWYGQPSAPPDAEGLIAISHNLDGLAGLSGERVGAEMLRLFSAPDPVSSVSAMAEAGVLDAILSCADHQPLARLVQLEADAKVTPDPIRRLAVLGGQNVDMRLRFSAKQTRRYLLYLERQNDDAPADELAYRHGAEAACDIVLLRAAIHDRKIPARLVTMLETGAAATFPVRAADLMPEFTGAALGRQLSALEDRWIKSGFSLGRDELLS